MDVNNQSILDTQQQALEKLNRRMKEMGNRIALLEASLLNKMAMEGGSISVPVSMKGGGVSGIHHPASMPNSSHSMEDNAECDNYALRKRTIV